MMVSTETITLGRRMIEPREKKNRLNLDPRDKAKLVRILIYREFINPIKTLREGQ